MNPEKTEAMQKVADSGGTKKSKKRAANRSARRNKRVMRICCKSDHLT